MTTELFFTAYYITLKGKSNMIRKIIQIDREKCTGCGICAQACHEGAIGIVDGKAELLRDDYCDGFGDCLPGCPEGAISFVEREAAAYDEKAVMKNREAKMKGTEHAGIHSEGHVCPGSRMQTLERGDFPAEKPEQDLTQSRSMLGQWPCQIKLVPENAPYFDGARLLVAADCTAYAYAGMHKEFMRGRITLIGCPKLDAVDYTEKLSRIISSNDIKEVVIVRMEVPCCGGLENAVRSALMKSGKFLPWRVVTISIDGRILD